MSAEDFPAKGEGLLVMLNQDQVGLLQTTLLYDNMTQVASHLFYHPRVIRGFMEDIKRTLGVKSNLEAVIRAIRWDLIDSEHVIGPQAPIKYITDNERAVVEQMMHGYDSDIVASQVTRLPVNTSLLYIARYYPTELAVRPFDEVPPNFLLTLTPMQQDILERSARGETTEVIAQQLGLNEDQVHKKVDMAMAKLRHYMRSGFRTQVGKLAGESAEDQYDD